MTDEQDQNEERFYPDAVDEFVNLYDAATDETGRGSYFTELEPDPERWSQILTHPRFNHDMRQLDDLMADYDHVIKLQIGEDSFDQVHIQNQSIPTDLNFYIAEDPDQFRNDVNHRFFRNVNEEQFTVPAGARIGFRFDSYRDTIDVPEDMDHVDISVPTRASHLYKQVETSADYEAMLGDTDPEELLGYGSEEDSIDGYDLNRHTTDF